MLVFDRLFRPLHCFNHALPGLVDSFACTRSRLGSCCEEEKLISTYDILEFPCSVSMELFGLHHRQLWIAANIIKYYLYPLSDL